MSLQMLFLLSRLDIFLLNSVPKEMVLEEGSSKIYPRWNQDASFNNWRTNQLHEQPSKIILKANPK